MLSKMGESWQNLTYSLHFYRQRASLSGSITPTLFSFILANPVFRRPLWDDLGFEIGLWGQGCWFGGQKSQFGRWNLPRNNRFWFWGRWLFLIFLNWTLKLRIYSFRIWINLYPKTGSILGLDHLIINLGFLEFGSGLGLFFGGKGLSRRWGYTPYKGCCCRNEWSA